MIRRDTDNEAGARSDGLMIVSVILLRHLRTLRLQLIRYTLVLALVTKC